MDKIGQSLQLQSQTGRSAYDKNKTEKQEPCLFEDKFTPAEGLAFSKSDILPSGKLGVIVTSENPEKLEEAKAAFIEKEDKSIKADLHAITGFAAEIDPDCAGFIAGLKEKIGVNIIADRKAKVITPPQEEPTVQLYGYKDLAGRTIGVDKLWDKGLKGKGVTICVIDSGIAKHPDFEGRIVEFKDFINKKDGPENAYDDMGHGTHCAGIAAGSGKESGGKFSGAAPEASLVGVKVLDNSGYAPLSTIVQGVQWAIDNKDRLGIDIISMSVGWPAIDSYTQELVAVTAEKAVEKGIICFFSAGNDGPGQATINTPGNAPHGITVGAMDDRATIDKSDDRMAEFSSRGPTRYDAIDKPDIIAPGVDISAPNSKGGYMRRSGTSMSTPLAAGVAALLKQASPFTDPAKMKELLMSTTDDLKGAPVEEQGKGVINPLKAYEKLTGKKID